MIDRAARDHGDDRVNGGKRERLCWRDFGRLRIGVELDRIRCA